MTTKLFRRKMHLFNSLSKNVKKVNKELNWYSCGPTVYAPAHVGHGRTYVMQDVLHRVLKHYLNYNVNYVLGITDIDDKIINAAKDGRVLEHAKKYEGAFFDDLEKLNVMRPDAVVRVSDHIDVIVKYVQTLVDTGFAYEVKGVGVYFDTIRFGGEYGKLKKEQDGELEEQVGDKRNSRDFALWKCDKDGFGWESMWGKGRPGWHIECSAMIEYQVGNRLDLHTGGVDLCFPHHNNEIAQSEAYNKIVYGDPQWCEHFAHFGTLNIKGLKMSKSLKNYITIQDLLQTVSADQFRMFCLQYLYRSNVHFAPERMEEAQALLDRIERFIQTVNAVENRELSSAWKEQDRMLFSRLKVTRKVVHDALNLDFNTPSALRAILELIADCNKHMTQHDKPNLDVLYSIKSYVLQMMRIFGFKMVQTDESNDTALVDAVVQFRSQVRQSAIKMDSMHAGTILKACDTIRYVQSPEFKNHFIG